ncbi:MAG: hypothetical protein HC842_01290 [Cytophagales bacterium]|nr:hypothetical protein [Cytophagales bacterium]
MYAAYMAQDYDALDLWLTTAKSQIHDRLDLVPFIIFEIQALKAQNKFTQAIEVGLAHLAVLGVKINSQPSLFQVIVQFIQLQNLLKKKPMTSSGSCLS